MRHFALTIALSVGMSLACSCKDKADELEQPAPRAEREPAKSQSEPRAEEPDPKQEALATSLDEHRGEPWEMSFSQVPEWFFRPDPQLREYMPDGEPLEWQAQFDCSGQKSPACNLHYEIDLRRDAGGDEVFQAAAELTEAGFQLVDEQPPSFKAIRPVEYSNAVDVVYVNQPPGMDSVEMVVVLRAPVEPTVTTLLAQPRLGPVAEFAVDVVSVPNSINVERARYEETIAYTVMFDRPEETRSAVERYLEQAGFELVRRGEAEASTSTWRHPSGWKASLEGDESVYKRFLIYFTRSEKPGTDATD
ncbi:MAG: hypothetical protein ACQEVA_06900 [Myxococcota bacterium]